MKSPWTAQPCSLSSSALTAESTPPESPTMIGIAALEVIVFSSGRALERDRWHGQSRSEIEVGNRRQGLALAMQVVLDASQHQRATQSLSALFQLVAGQPMGADYAIIQGLIQLVIIDIAAEGKPHRRDAAL